MASPEEITEEALRARKVRQLVDISTNFIMQSRVTRQEAAQIVADVRQRILTLFPDGEGAYEVIYAPRFKRLIEEFSIDTTPARAAVIAFPTRRD